MRLKELGALALVSSILALTPACRPRPKPSLDLPVESVASGEVDPSLPQPMAGAGGASEQSEPPSCELVSGSGFVVGDPGKRQLGSDESVDEPFGTDLGGAISVRGGFAVGALVNGPNGPEAQVLWLPADAHTGGVAALGSVHGGGPPPEVSWNSELVVVAIPDTDASGKTLRLATVSDVNPKRVVHFGTEQQVGRDDSDAFSLATVRERSLLVWDDFDKKAKPGGHSVVRAISFNPAVPDAKLEPFQVSPPGVDAEAPRLVARGDAYWLVWTARGAKASAKKRLQPPSLGSTSEASEDPRLVESENRFLQAVLLDLTGKPLGKALNLSSPAGQVLSYDVSVDATGALVVVFRDESTLGVERDTVELARVLPDGSVLRRSWAAKGEPGAPHLLFDAGRPRPQLWMALSDESGSMRLTEVLPEQPTLRFSTEPVLAQSRALAMTEGRVLLAQPKGQAARLLTAQCGAKNAVQKR